MNAMALSKGDLGGDFGVAFQSTIEYMLTGVQNNSIVVVVALVIVFE
jgi:hypothetical protein